MKIKLIMIMAVMGWALQAAHVRDDINMLKGQSAQLEEKLKDSKCYVEFIKTAQPNIRDYGNAELQTLAGTNGGFLIVVTTEPKQWRISQWPLSIVASSVIERAGDSMTLQFHQGNFYQAILDAKAVLEPEKSKASQLIFWFIIGIIAATGFVFVIWSIYTLSKVKTPEKKKEKEDEQSADEKLTDAQKWKADKIFDRYSESEREQIAMRYQSSPYYCSGCHNDSFLFYYLLFNNGGLNSGGSSIINNNYYNEPSASHSEPSANYSYTPPVDPPRSSSYESSDSGASSSWSSSSDSSSSFSSDSSGGGSSDSSSSSSSDSSGGGGSW